MILKAPVPGLWTYILYIHPPQRGGEKGMENAAKAGCEISSLHCLGVYLYMRFYVSDVYLESARLNFYKDIYLLQK